MLRGNPAAQHEGILRRGHVEEPVVAPAEVILRLRELPLPRLGRKSRIAVERMLGALPLFLLGKLAGGMQAPIATLAGLLAANIRNLGYALSQVRDQKAQSEGA